MGKEKRKHRSRSRSPRHRSKHKHKPRRRSRSSSAERVISKDETNPSKVVHLPPQEEIRAELHKIKEQRKKHKELMKAFETPEEKRARRLAKKEAKEKKRRERLGWDAEQLEYTNTNNPFGDHNLLDTFTWHKKLESQGIQDVDTHILKRDALKRAEENKRELEKVKRRKMEREVEKAAREDELNLTQRERESAMFQEWEQQEDSFHLEQARLRSKIRIQDGRAKPIDLLAAYVNPNEEDLELQMHEPYAVLVGLSVDDLEDLLEDIKVYMTLEQGNNTEFWEDMTTIAKDELAKLKKAREEDDLVNRREVINASVQKDVSSVFKGKTQKELVTLRKQIQQKISSGGAIDIGYWECLLSQLKAHIAKARLSERHRNLLRKKLEDLRNQPSMQEESEGESESKDGVKVKVEEEEELEASPGAVGSEIRDNERDSAAETDKEESETPTEQMISEEQILAESYDRYESGSYSPRLVPFSSADQSKWVSYEEDFERLQYLREQVRAGSTVEEEETAERNYQNESEKAMGDSEDAFNVPVPLTQKVYSWADKYRPRKPRFFNRVHTGYEWNKYNQTHYDSENPPPKIVQGYKFNIFYPDLIDATATPEYHLTPCKDNKDFAILKFVAGPPYEDIGFKVVNREWELSHKHGFRCQFQNNIFQLWFHFKRYRYRR